MQHFRRKGNSKKATHHNMDTEELYADLYKGKTFFYDRGKEIPMDNTTIEIYYQKQARKLGKVLQNN